MDRTVRASLLAASLGVALLAAACTPPGSGAPGDGTWAGGPSFDFNDPANWKPTGVPTGTATVPVGSSPPAPFITFSAPSTTLAAVKLEGDLGIDLRNTLKLTGRGLVVCCGRATAMITGALTGNVTLGEAPGQSNHQLSGSGTIYGNVLQSGGMLTPGNGPDQLAMTVVGTYHELAKAILVIDVWPASANRLDVRGTATLEGVLGIYVDDETKVPATPFKILTSDHGVQSKFIQVVVLNSDKLKADVTYNTNDVEIRLSRR
jgi:hypothetical protein